LALLVLLCTAVALLLPAFTLEKDVFCGLEEHTHTEACYELVPVCAVEEHAAHTHTDACFETVRELSCGLEESEGHTHTDACFAVEKELTCGIAEDAGHTHTDACYIEEREPVCGIVETEGHAHDDSCWSTEQDLVCELEENEEHQHDDACYIETSVLVCGEEEREAHTHDESCYVTRLVPNCGEEEREGHTHDENCYTVNRINVCNLEESEGHTHTDACYTDTQKLICTLPEDEGHTHSEACMEEKLVCEKEEHTHSLQCYSNPEAVESEAMRARTQIPESRITYRKNGEKVDSAQFFNTLDKASVTVTKTFSGDYPLSDGFKNQVTFTVREKPVPPATEGKLIKTFTYGQMTAGTYTLTEADGIEADKEYIVTESNADITGTVRTTTYTIKGVKSMETPERPATVSTEGDKAAKVDFDNSYKPKSMNLYREKPMFL
jgi:hypothetical protein